MAGRYVPEAGDIVWLQCNPQSGQEQAGHRPALVVSPRSYNQQGWAHAVLPDDYVRQAAFKSRAPKSVLQEVRGKLKALIG